MGNILTKNSKRGSEHGSYSGRYRSASLACLLAMGAGLAFGDLASVKAEPNLEHRSEKALEYANEVLTEARQQYQAGEFDKFKQSVGQVGEAAELTVSSLEDTGKAGRKYPKYYKRAEIAMRTLLRRIENLRQE